jgi:hypothetical protein
MNYFFRKLGSLKLFYSLSLLVTLVVFIYAITFAALDYYNFRQEVDSAIKEQNIRAKNRFLEMFVHTKYIAESISRQILIKHSGQKEIDYEFINSLLIGYRNSVNELISWSAFSWADKNSNVVVSSSVGILKTPISLKNRDYIPLTISYPNHIHLGKPVISAVSRFWSIPAGYGVVDQRGNYLGAVVTGMILDGVAQNIDESITDRNVTFAVVDAKGEILAKSLHFNLKKSKKFFEKLKAHPSAKSFRYKDGYYQKVDDYPYGVVTFYRHGLLKDKLTSVSIHMFFIAIVLFVIHLIFAFFYKKLLLPMFQLSEMATKVLQGEKLEHKVPKFEIEEVEDFAKAIRSANKRR